MKVRDTRIRDLDKYFIINDKLCDTDLATSISAMAYMVQVDARHSVIRHNETRHNETRHNEADYFSH